MALARARSGQRERAVALIEETVRRWPEDFQAHLMHAVFLAAAGDRQRAQAAYDAALRLRPNDPTVAGGFDATLARMLPTMLPSGGL